MIQGFSHTVYALAFTMLTIASVLAQPSQSWEALVTAAEAEGSVNIHGGPGRAFQSALNDGFTKAFPKIKVNYDGAPGREAIPKIVRERQAGIYNWDVYVGGPNSLLPALKPIKGLKDLRAELVLPEVLDDKAWRSGFEAGWPDIEKKYMYSFDFNEESTLVINWDFVKPDQIKTAEDLLKPEFIGKIVSADPRLLGDAAFTYLQLYVTFGEQYVLDMFTKQKVVFTGNRRQAVEWLVRGTYPIGIATAMDEIRLFQEQGLGKNIRPLRMGTKVAVGGSGFGNVSILENAPHPNAARLYVNWLLSKQGQEGWKIMGRNTRRMDIPVAFPEFAPPPDVMTDNLQAEKYRPMWDYVAQLAKKHISTVTR